jgi:hypothetical protein
MIPNEGVPPLRSPSRPDNRKKREAQGRCTEDGGSLTTP